MSQFDHVRPGLYGSKISIYREAPQVKPCDKHYMRPSLPEVIEKIVARYARNSLPPEVKAELKKAVENRYHNFVKRGCTLTGMFDLNMKHFDEICNSPITLNQFWLQGDCDARLIYLEGKNTR